MRSDAEGFYPGTDSCCGVGASEKIYLQGNYSQSVGFYTQVSESVGLLGFYSQVFLN